MRTTGGAALAAAALVGGCSGTDEGSAARPDRVVVAAASSLTEALRSCSEPVDGARVRLSFAGSDELAAQIRQGVRPDVFAAADTKLPEQLAREGRVERPRAFASNEVVIAVPADSTVDDPGDLASRGVTVAVGARSVPIGAYTREVLGRLDDATEDAILANVRSEEPDVRGVVGKVALGAVDAGFVYASDVRAARGRLRTVRLARRLRPDVAYGAAVVRDAPNARGARRYLERLTGGSCRKALRGAGFGPPPR